MVLVYAATKGCDPSQGAMEAPGEGYTKNTEYNAEVTAERLRGRQADTKTHNAWLVEQGTPHPYFVCKHPGTNTSGSSIYLQPYLL